MRLQRSRSDHIPPRERRRTSHNPREALRVPPAVNASCGTRMRRALLFGSCLATGVSARAGRRGRTDLARRCWSRRIAVACRRAASPPSAAPRRAPARRSALRRRTEASRPHEFFKGSEDFVAGARETSSGSGSEDRPEVEGENEGGTKAVCRMPREVGGPRR